MIDYREIIRLKSADYSNTSVASSTGSSRNKVADIWKKAQEKQIGWPIPDNLTNEDLKAILYPQEAAEQSRLMPDYEYVYSELAKPGEQLQADWIGDTISVTDPFTGLTDPAYVFVACLPCSMYGYAEAFPDMKAPHWIEAHVHAYEFFGGVTRILIPDNLKTGVIKNTRTELVLNRSYHEMAEHYDTAIIPARPWIPKDKPAAEGSVKVMETWILAALRNRTFFTCDELNLAIREKLTEYNEHPFRKKKGSRKSVFEEEEKEFLKPLPAAPYETAVWSTATIQPDYLISVGESKYSVPYEFIGRKVDIRATEKVIEVFYHNNRITSSERPMS